MNFFRQRPIPPVQPEVSATSKKEQRPKKVISHNEGSGPRRTLI